MAGEYPSDILRWWRALAVLLVVLILGCAAPEPPPPPSPTATPSPQPSPTPKPPPYETVARAAAQGYLSLDLQRDGTRSERGATEAEALAREIRAAAARDERANRDAAEELARALDLLATVLRSPDQAPGILPQARARYAAFLAQPLTRVLIVMPTAVPSYRVHAERVATRDGWRAAEVRVEVDPRSSAGEIMLVMLTALRTVRERTGAEAAVAYAYWPTDDPNGPFTAGRASYACGGRGTLLGYPPDCDTVYMDLAPDREMPRQRSHQTVPYRRR